MNGVWKSIVWGGVTIFILSGCATMSARQRSIWEGATMGAIIGGGGGAVLGNHDDDRSDRDKGALVGIVAGGIIGGFLGAMQEPTEKQIVVEPAPMVEPEVAKLAPQPTRKPYKVKVIQTPETAPPSAPAQVETATTLPSIAVVKERIVLRGINFYFDKSEIKPEFTPVLDEAARILNQRSDLREVIIEGHTCWVGTDKYNQGLSQRRADAVRAYLVRKGVRAKRLTTIGYGESRPLADNNTWKGRRMNRRVEFKVMGE